MKTLALICVFSLMTGCSTPGGIINKALDATLPPTFTGPATIRHKNPSITLDIKAEGLERRQDGWTWKWLTYTRSGRFSEGEVTLGSK